MGIECDDVTVQADPSLEPLLNLEALGMLGVGSFWRSPVKVSTPNKKKK